MKFVPFPFAGTLARSIASLGVATIGVLMVSSFMAGRVFAQDAAENRPDDVRQNGTREDHPWKIAFATNERLPKPFVQLDITRADQSTMTAFVGNFNKDISTRKPLLVYLEGSGAQSHFVSMDGKTGIGVFGLIAMNHGKTHHVAATEKRGVKFGDTESRGTAMGATEEYNRFATLDDRVAEVRLLLDVLLAEAAVDASQVILLGHSEGADVAAAVQAVDSRVTHVAFLSGGGAAQFFDFYAQTRKRLAKENATAEEVEQQIAGLEHQIREILADPESETRMFAGHAFKRWSTFATVAAADNLAKGTAKLFLAHGTADEAVPIESFDYLVVELMNKRRENVTVKRFPACDHSYIPVGAEPSNDPFQNVIADVLKWAAIPSSQVPTAQESPTANTNDQKRSDDDIPS